MSGLNWQDLGRLLRQLLVVTILLASPVTTYGQQQEELTPPRAEVKAIVGGASFGEEIPHGVVGGAVRIYLSPRISLEPEFLYMRHSRNDQDFLFQPNIAVDLTQPNGRIVPYVIAGIGVINNRSRFSGQDFDTGAPREFDTSFTSWTASAGGGVKIFLTDRFFISPEVRVGREPSVRGTINVGYVFSGRN